MLLLAITASIEAAEPFFTIKELTVTNNTENQDYFLTSVAPDGSAYEAVSFGAFNFGDYYRMQPYQMINPQYLDLMQGCIYSPTLCKYLRTGQIQSVDQSKPESDIRISGWRKQLHDTQAWLLPSLLGSMQQGVVTAFSEDSSVRVGYYTSTQKNEKKFYSQLGFVKVGDAQKISLPSQVDNQKKDGFESPITRPTTVKKVEVDEHWYLIGGSIAVEALGDALSELYNPEKESFQGYPGYKMQAATWLLDSRNEKVYGPFLADYLQTKDGDVLHTASVNDVAKVDNDWYAVGYSTIFTSEKSTVPNNVAVYWPLALELENNPNVSYQSIKKIAFSVGESRDNKKTFVYTNAEKIRADGLIVGRVVYQIPEYRNFPIKAFTFRLNDEKAKFEFESALPNGANHAITSIVHGSSSVALGWQDVSNQLYATVNASARIYEGALFDFQSKKTFSLNRLVGTDGFQNGYFYRISTPVGSDDNGVIYATAFRYGSKAAYLGQRAGEPREVVLVKLIPQNKDYHQSKASSSLQSLSSVLENYLNPPFHPGLVLPVTAGAIDIESIFLLGLMLLLNIKMRRNRKLLL